MNKKIQCPLCGYINDINDNLNKLKYVSCLNCGILFNPIVCFDNLTIGVLLDTTTIAKIPKKAYESDSGYDLLAIETETISAGKVKILRTGISVQLPHNIELQIRTKSGLGSKGIMVANSPGTIDCNYRGEIKVALFNSGGTFTEFRVNPGDKIAQMVIGRVISATLVQRIELSKTDRGDGGFGSTDKL